MTRWLWQAALVATLAAPGCGGGPLPAGPAAEQPQEILRRELAQFPKIGKYEPPLDSYRVQIAPPEGWRATQGLNFLIGFKPQGQGELPRITVIAEDPPAGYPADLTEVEAPGLALLLDQGLRKAVSEKQKSVEEFSLPIVLGENVFIRHVRRVQTGGAKCIVQSLATIKNSRMYTVELIAAIEPPQSAEYEASLLKYRDYAYAVAGHMRFAPPGKTFDPSAGPKPKPPLTEAKKAAPAPEAATPKTAPPKSAPAAPAGEKPNKSEKTTEKKSA